MSESGPGTDYFANVFYVSIYLKFGTYISAKFLVKLKGKLFISPRSGPEIDQFVKILSIAQLT